MPSDKEIEAAYEAIKKVNFEDADGHTLMPANRCMWFAKAALEAAENVRPESEDKGQCNHKYQEDFCGANIAICVKCNEVR